MAHRKAHRAPLALSALILTAPLACADLIGLRPPNPEVGSSGGLGGDDGNGSGASPSGDGGNGTSTGGVGPNAGGNSSTGATNGAGGDGAGGNGAGGDGAGGNGTGGNGTGGEPPIPEPTLITSGPGSYWVEGEVTEGGTTADVTVDASDTFQVWHGFGGTFSERGWDAALELTGSDRARALELLFSKTDGAGFSWGRIPIGASDYAMDRYTLNETSGDTSMDDFSIERDEELLLPFVQAAYEVNTGLKFWGTPWTPPPWMKTNSAYDGGEMENQANFLQAYALYLAKWVEAYEAKGFLIHHIQPQSDLGYESDFPSCSWGHDGGGGPFFGTFVEDYLSVTFDTRGVTAGIWYGSLSNDSAFDDYWGTLPPAGQGGVISGVGLEWATVVRVAEIRSVHPEMLIMQTAHQCGNYPWLGSATTPEDANRNNFLASQAPNNHAYGEETWDLISTWLEAGVNAYVFPHMILDSIGLSLDVVRPWPQNSLLAVDVTTGELVVTPAYYVARHVSQYVDDGAIRLGTTGGDALAFENPDGTIVTVLSNPADSDALTTLDVDGTLLEFSIPAHGWVTVNWEG